MRFVLIALLLSCTVAEAAENCPSFPTDAEFRKMDTRMLYEYYKLTRQFQELIGEYTSTRRPIPECAARIAAKNEVIYQELRFR